MNNQERMFLTINTRVLWEHFRDATVEGADNIQITEKGIALRETQACAYTETLSTDSTAPVSLALDTCGTLYLLDKYKEAILIYYPDTKNSFWFKCLSFPNPKSLAVSNADIYVVYQQTLLCLARVNYQIRWEREIAEDIRIASAGNNELYLLLKESETDFKICKTDRSWQLQEIFIKDAEGTPHQLVTSVDIASDTKKNFYILEADTREILKCDPEGTILEIISIPYTETSEPFSLAADSQGDIWVSFKEKPEIIKLQNVLKYRKTGVYITQSQRPLDSNVPDCRWHKMVLDADIPENTQIKLSYYISNDPQRPDKPSCSEPLVNPKDALLLNVKGQYLWWRIELLSDDLQASSPLVKSLKSYFPRHSYLRYLPAIYQEDLDSRNFLERFLSLFETFLGDIEGTLETVLALFDANAAPEEFLSWLSTWLGTIRDENWKEDTWRKFLSRAVQLYKLRGTKTYLNELIKLYTGEEPIIVEQSLLQCADADMKPLLEKLFGSTPYSFCVLLKPGQVTKEGERNAVKRIIDTGKPAHTIGGLQVLQPWIVLGGHSYLEINTNLSTPEFIAGKAVLPIDTVLEDTEKGAQIERHSRIEIDTFMT